ncbi:MAG: thiamine pyrophosphate-dependent enzyme [candidate division WOR-3 bacterium]
MTEADFLSPEPLPFCPGCGHHLVARNAAKALVRLGLKPLEVVVVTDIGCHGIIDRFFLTHTVHGLHGRASALAAGIAAGLGRGKVIVFMGDGGASIGLQHLVECATRNFPLTVVVHNNMLYGMTGGQPSALTPCGFRTAATPDGKIVPGYDLCRIIRAAGAPYVCRVNGVGDFSETLAEAFAIDGFSLVEVIESCPSYGLRFNPGRKPAEIAEAAGLEFGVWRNPDRPAARLELTEKGKCHCEERSDEAISRLPRASGPRSDRKREMSFASPLSGRFSIVVAGSAGGRVQNAAELIARAAISAGLHVTKKSSYPVTVGTGYSVAELILAPEPILFTGLTEPDAVVIVSADGLSYVRQMVEQLAGGTLVIDDSLTVPATGARVVRRPFRTVAGPKNAALLALAFLVQEQALLPVDKLAALARTGWPDRKFDLAEGLSQLQKGER